MITLFEEQFLLIPKMSGFRSPRDALMDALKTPGIVESSDSIKSPDFIETNSRAKNGFSYDYLPQFKIKDDEPDG